jgi:MFS family permease
MASKDKGESKSSKAKKASKAAEPVAHPKSAGELYRIPRDSGWARAAQYAGVLAAVGVVLSLVAHNSDPQRFAFSWLFAIMTVLAIALGSLFFVIVQHITQAGWSVALRRTPETFASGLPVFIVFVVPLMLMHMDHLYPWMHYWRESVEQHESAAEEGAAAEEGGHSSADEALVGASVAHAQDRGEPREVEHGEEHSPEHAAHEATIRAKLGYLNQPFFLARMVIYLAIWLGLSWYFYSSSTQQDTSKDRQITNRLNKAAPLSLIAFALSLTFAAFDWMMSLEPTWFSTMFGVQYFAVSCVSSLAVMIVMMYLLREAGHFGDALNTEHFHDMGKLLFGFLVFWAYVTFSQFMLIWYASIPEETTYYHLRLSGGWRTFTWFLLVCHFFVPFFGILSRNIKRRVALITLGAAWLLVMHVLEVYWLVMPYTNGGTALTPHWMDGAALFAVAGTYLAFVFFRMGQHPLVPVGDPRLPESLHHEVT